MLVISSLKNRFVYSKIKTFIPVFYTQKREYYFPLVLTGTVINFYALTQVWNPYFPRGKLLSLINIGNGMFLIGLII